LAPGDYYIYSLFLLFVIIILLISNLVLWNKQLSKSKDLEDAIYRLIELNKMNSKKENVIDKSI
jgi:hypothetical protein